MRFPKLVVLGLLLLVTAGIAESTQAMASLHQAESTRESTGAVITSLCKLTVDDALCLKRVSDVRWSPDGRWIAYVVTEADTAENSFNSDIWLVSPESMETLKLTNSPKSDNTPEFSPDGKWLAFLSDRDEKQQLWVISTVAGEARRLTSADEGVTGHCWSPDSKEIVFVTRDTLTSDEKERKEEKKFDPVVLDKDVRYSHLWKTDPQTESLTRLTRGGFEATLPSWSPDGEWIAFKSNPTGKADDWYLTEVRLVPADSGEVRSFPDAFAKSGFLRWTSDSKGVVYCGTHDRRNFVEQSHIFLLSINDGSMRDLVTGFDTNCSAPVLSSDGSCVYFRAQQGCDEHICSVAIDDGKPTQLTERRGYRRYLDVSPDGESIAFTFEEPSAPREICVMDGSGELGQLTETNPQARFFTLGETSSIRWKSHDGQEVEGLLVKPVGYEEGKRYPAIVVVHGGPYSFRYANSFDPFLQLLSNEGYLVLAPNFRASGGYGQKFQARKRADWGGGDYQDIMSGVDEIVRLGLADPERLGVTGWSYGGYMTAWIVTHTDRFKAAVEGAGAVNLTSFYGQSDVKQYRSFEFTGTPWEKPGIFKKLSPLTYVTNVRTPVLLLHGELDERVPMPQAQEMYTALRGLGVETEFVKYPREPHGIRELNHRRDMYARYLEWFNRFLK